MRRVTEGNISLARIGEFFFCPRCCAPYFGETGDFNDAPFDINGIEAEVECHECGLDFTVGMYFDVRYRVVDKEGS